MANLFMNDVSKTHREANADDLLKLFNVPDALKEKLFKTKNYKVRINKPTRYQYGQHAYRTCTNDNDILKKDESRLCKCLFFYNIGKSKESCQLCNFIDRYKLNNFTIPEYEFPAYHEEPKLGRIDLIIKLNNEDTLYATEVKSYSEKGKNNNDESLIRMIAEIMTYATGYEERFKKAIAFFEDSEQHNEFKSLDANSNISKLLNAAQITVFMFKRTAPTIQNGKCVSPGTISIEKLYPPTHP